MRTVVRDFSVRGRHFTIVKNDGWYLAIEDKYIDKNGCITQALNGFQTHAEKSLEECMTRTRDCVEVRYLMDKYNINSMQAMKIYFDLVEQEV